MKPLHNQIGGRHYVDLAIQPVEYIHANQMTFLEGNVVKYVTRHRSKNGKADILKAMHYLELILELEYGLESQDGGKPPSPPFAEYGP